MDTPEWQSGASKGLLPSGKVPVLWEGDIAVWDSLAIIDWLADRLRTARISRGHYWPHDLAARALARSMCAEMHSGFTSLRGTCSMNLQRDYPDFVPDAAVLADVARIDALWTTARTSYHSIDEAHEGPFLFGTLERRRHHVRPRRDADQDLRPRGRRDQPALRRRDARAPVDGRMDRAPRAPRPIRSRATISRRSAASAAAFRRADAESDLSSPRKRGPMTTTV